MLKRRRTEQDEMLIDGTFAPSPPPSPEPSPATKNRRRKRRGSFLRQVGAVVGLLVAGYAALPFLLSAGRIQPIVEATLSRELGRQVRVGSLRFSPTFGTLIASDVSIADDPAFSSAPFFYAQRVDLSVKRIPLIFSRSLEITSVVLEAPTVTLIHNAAQWNFYGVLASGRTGGDTERGPSLRISRGILVIRASDRVEPFVLRDVDLDSPGISTALDNTFTLTSAIGGGGTLKLNGNWGPVTWQGRSPIVPINILVNAKKVALSESNLTAAFAPSVEGIMSLDGAIESDGTSVRVTGNAEFDRLKLSKRGQPAGEPLMFGFALSHDTARGAGVLSRCDLSLQKGSASIAGTYIMAGDDPILKLKVVGQGVPVTPVSGLLTAAGLPLPPGTSLQGGVAFIDLSIEGDLDGPTTSGSVAMNNTKLMNFDLEERFSSVDGLDLLHIKRDIEINEWRSTVHFTPEKITLSDLQADLPGVGAFAGGGSIDANRILDFQMSAVRHGTSDKRPIPFVVRGACISPIFRQPGKPS
jgi:AsmA protein